jgi:hypothetical protein
MMRASLSVAQELFISTEPASNMPARSWGVRLGAETGSMNDVLRTRTEFEVMYGFSKELMVHAQLYASNHLGTYAYENIGLYAKYRLFTDDDFKYHLRSALYGKLMLGKQSTRTPLAGLDGGTSGYGGGIITTILTNHFATSLTLGVAFGAPDITTDEHHVYRGITSYNYALSFGYLLLPSEYKSYNDPNLNFYAEFLGKYATYDDDEHGERTASNANEVILSVGPQVILNSIARIDLAFRTVISSNAVHQTPNTIVLKFERIFY